MPRCSLGSEEHAVCLVPDILFKSNMQSRGTSDQASREGRDNEQEPAGWWGRADGRGFAAGKSDADYETPVLTMLIIIIITRLIDTLILTRTEY